MIAVISVRSMSLQIVQGLVSTAAAAGATVDLACFDIDVDAATLRATPALK